jgi:hypothetical protein
LSGESTLTAAGTYVGVGSAALSAQSALSAAATVVEIGVSIIVGTSDLSASATRVAVGAAGLSADAVLTALGGLIVNAGTAELAGDLDLAASGTAVRTGAVVSMSATLTLAPVTPEPIYRLLDPTSEQVYTEILPFSRFGIDVGKTILINGTDLQVVETPMMQELSSADFYFLGGRQYQLTDEEYAAFVACGRTDLVEVA